MLRDRALPASPYLVLFSAELLSERAQAPGLHRPRSRISISPFHRPRPLRANALPNQRRCIKPRRPRNLPAPQLLEPQPVHDASAFLLRQCLRNYNDLDAVKITCSIVPALEKCVPGTLLLLNEVILPESGSTARHIEHHLRQVDVTMMVVLGAKQRSRSEFERLLKQADSRYEVMRTFDNPMGVGLLEVHLKAS